ncbi:MAG: hypothetical protein FWE71_04265 [Nocardioidaceae bacterium]|nr:hypothetical protein [Nocardioidaceae bacterium]MCL2612978.1 hypothetical protein [Nocardioidaceae bacterium]
MTAGMDITQVMKSQQTWDGGAQSLQDIHNSITHLSPKTIAAFGDSQTGNGAKSALDLIRQKLHARHVQMKDASEALTTVITAMGNAQNTQSGAAPAPGAAPKYNYSGDPASAEGVKYQKQFNQATTKHNSAVSAYNKSDTQAGQVVGNVDATYAAAAAVFAKIHGDPTVPGTGGSTSGTTTPGAGTPPRAVGVTPTSPPRHHSTSTPPPPRPPAVTPIGPTGHGNPPPPVEPPPPAVGPGTGVPPTPGPVPAGPGGGGPSGGPSGGLLSSPMTAGGVAGAGILGGAGLRGMLGTVRPASVSVPGEPTVNALGETERTGDTGVLGRGAAGRAIPGQATSRGGSRGTAGAAGGRRKRRDKRAVDGDGYDVEEDWTDDDGQYPGVIS